MHGREEMEGDACAISLHGIVEAAEGRLARVGLMPDPVDGKADAEPAEHGQIPSGGGSANPALVLACNHVQPLMQTAFDAPVTALVVEQRTGIIGAWVVGGQQEELFEGSLWLAGIVHCLLQFRALLGEGETHLLGTDRKTGDATRLRAPLVDLRALR